MFVHGLIIGGEVVWATCVYWYCGIIMGIKISAGVGGEMLL